MSNPKAMQNYLKYLDTYYGKELLKDHSLTKVGIWEIRGEDPNCDLGGSHYQPKLGIVQGKLQDVILFGANLDRFWEWGSGGNFIFIGNEKTIPQIDEQSIDAMDSLKEEAVKLEARLEEIKKQLKGE